MVTAPTPLVPAHCIRFAWHCDQCQGDNVFDIEAQGQPSQAPVACLGCGHTMPVYLDTGVRHRHFRAQGANAWQPHL